LFSRRRARIHLDDYRVDALLVNGLPNICYLTGFTGSNALLLLDSEDGATLFTDPRYTTQAASECDCPVTTVRKGSVFDAAAKAIIKRRYRRVGFEQNRLSWHAWNSLRNALGKPFDLQPVDQAIERLRMVKDAAEIECIRVSVEVNSRAFEAAIGTFRAELEEAEFAAEIDYQMRLLGASGPAFETIVASGPHAALPHAKPQHRPILRNQVVLVDMGASLDGYASDMTRTLVAGKLTPEIRRMYQATLEAQLAAIDTVRPGVEASKVDAAARKVLRTHNLDREFVHSTGHGLGLEIHESPRLGKGERTKLEPGMTITIEPGVYRPGVCGIRIEDTVLVTERGCEVLTPTPKELRSL
jgi:Xaa-Pro aminopeptidase